MRKLLFVLPALLLVSVGLHDAVAAPPALLATLTPGDHVFWDGPVIERSGLGLRAQDEFLCRHPAGSMYGCYAGQHAISYVPPQLACGVTIECFDSFIEVRAGGSALHVAIDVPSGRDTVWFELFRPDGSATSIGDPNRSPTPYGYGPIFPGGFSASATIPNPEPGVWTVRTIAYDVVDSGFRMRARLEPPLHGSGRPRRLLPNLQTVPPFELTFAGCQATETATYSPYRCLRMSTGPANTGDGPLDLRIPPGGDRLGGTQYQRVHYSDGSTKDQPAGTYELHLAHQHYHHTGTAGWELYRVEDPATGAMHHAGDGPKIGFCMGDYAIADWSKFRADVQGSGSGDCNGSGYTDPTASHMGLTRGWADMYAYWVEANYVDFGANGDGLYLVRATADPGDTIEETDERDNTGYTYFRVTGDSITVLERGTGASPWDTDRVVVNDTRPATV